MAKNKSINDVKKIIVEAALALAAAQPWGGVTLHDIANEAKVSLSELRELFDDRADIMMAFTRMIDMKVIEAAGPFDESESAKDRLFDILMERFEVLNEHRAGLLGVMSSMKSDPAQAFVCFPTLIKSMVWMMEAAALDTSGYRGAIKAAGLAGVYARCLKVWAEDESADLSKTMSALDQALGRAEQFASTFGL